MADQGDTKAAQRAAVQRQEIAKDQLAKEELRKKEAQQEWILAYVKAFQSSLDADDPNAAIKALSEVTLAKVIASSIAGFYEGTENVGESLGQPAFKGRDGYLVRVDGSERVMTGAQNQMVGSLSNDHLAELARASVAATSATNTSD